MKKEEILKKASENQNATESRLAIYRLLNASKLCLVSAIIIALIGVIGIILCLFEPIITVGYAAFFSLITTTVFLSCLLIAFSIFFKAFARIVKDGEESKKLQRLLIEIEADNAE